MTAQLLHPVTIGGLRLPNRVVMAPTTRARATNADLVPTSLHATHYSQRAAAGLIISEGTWVSRRAIGFPDVPGVYSDPQVVGWRQVTDVVHAVGGRIVAQLWHGGSTPHEQRIDDVVADYRAATGNARRAGFDGVEIAANGTYLLGQFLNARLNQRTDTYGTQRGRLLLDIVDAVTDRWPDGCVGVRLSPYWADADRPRAERHLGDYPYTADADTLACHDDVVAALDRRPLTYLHLRGRAGAVPDFAAIARYRALFSGPLIANHGFDRDTGDAIIAAGIADAVSFAKLFIANPDLVSRFALGHDLATSDHATHYTGGAHGYVDYPIWAAS
ncbi:MAG TPA: alkene reductase [Pseudonocardiaceae bacterium]|nr:alkene reductase [Pseudonocardiaceae bacterium]